MAKEILLYSPIYSFTAEDYISQLEANKDTDISVRMNCPGGDVLACYGMIAKFNEHKKGKKIQVDGMAKSCGFYMCLVANAVESLDVSEFMVHRASYGTWIERDPERFTDDLKESLNRTNNDLRSLIEAKVSADVFQAIAGTSLDDLFSLDSRLDVSLTAEQMKAMGIVSKITKLTSDKKNQIMALASTQGVAAFAKDPQFEATTINDNQNNMANTITTLAEFKAEHKALYNEALALGATEERDRVGSWMAFNEVDPIAVKAGIASGVCISETQRSEFSIKAYSKQALAGVQEDGKAASAIQTTEAKPDSVLAKTAEEKEAQEVLDYRNSIKADVLADFGVKAK